ncbi:MAG: DUF5659 domain-containing protein [Agathobacter sp.]
MNNKYYPVFSKNLAERLFFAGFFLSHTDWNKKRRNMKVYYFAETPELRAAVEAYRTEVRNGKHKE